jgi:hypothetical protein
MEQHPICNLCRKTVPIHESFVVRIEVFADPSLPPMSGAQLAAIDSGQAMQQLLEQMKTMSTDELQDGVHRRFEYRLCAACQREFLRNPLGRPRTHEAGFN